MHFPFFYIQLPRHPVTHRRPGFASALLWRRLIACAWQPLRLGCVLLLSLVALLWSAIIWFMLGMCVFSPIGKRLDACGVDWRVIQ